MRTLHSCAFALVAACSATTPSNTVRTSGLVALIDITAERPDRAVVSAVVLLAGHHSNSRVMLDGSDRLQASSAGERLDMQSLDNGTYEARFARSDGKFVVSLLRADDIGAPDSHGTMPVPFEITSKFGDRPLSRTHDPLAVTWTPSGSDAETSVELEGDCIHSEEFRLAGDTGAYVIEAGRVNAWKSQEHDSCSVAVRVVLLRHGRADPALDRDSSVVLRQIRTARFASGP